MELFYDPGRSNPLRDRTTGILSDLLSEVIERVKSRTGEDMLSVAEGLQVNRHNNLLRAIPLKEGVGDVCAAIKEHAASRKRKRTSKPSKSDNSSQGSDSDRTGIANGHCSLLESSVNCKEVNRAEEKSNGHCSELSVTDERMEGNCSDQTNSQSTCLSNSTEHIVEDSLKLNQIELDATPVPSVTNNIKPPKTSEKPKRTSSRRAKLDSKIQASKPAAAPVPLSPVVQPHTDTKQTDSKQKKKRKSMKDQHKKCNKQLIKLEDVLLSDVPLVLDDDGDGLTTLIECECPDDWVPGKPRAPLFRKKHFCRKCVLGEE